MADVPLVIKVHCPQFNLMLRQPVLDGLDGAADQALDLVRCQGKGRGDLFGCGFRRLHPPDANGTASVRGSLPL